MPRVLIYCGPHATRRLADGLRGLDTAHGSLVCADELAAYVGRGTVADDSGISVAGGVTLALEGYLTHRPERGAALRAALIDDFLAHGECCVRGWRGSFRVLIAHGDAVRVYADHTASRAIFVAEDGYGPVYGSHAAPLLAALSRTTVDGANLLNFMRNGRFFAGGSLYHELRQLLPGQCHRIGRGGPPSAFRWYRYQLRPQPLTVDEVLPELKRRLDAAILRHWRRADAPVLLLSGGYDSRYLLNTLAQRVPAARLATLFSCLWGESNPDPDCDAAWAAAEAGRHGVGYAFFPLRADLPALFQATFDAQSGMTGHVLTHTDDVDRCRYLSGLGYRSLLRGDECFGPNGPAVRGVPEALARIGLRAVPEDLPWLDPDAAAAGWRAAHQRHLCRLGQLADDPNDVRDLLYHGERLPAVQAHLNAHREPYLANHNPLLDADVLDLVQELPRELRTDKLAFRLCFQRYFPTTGFAGTGNAFDQTRLWRQPELAEFVAGQLAQVPAPLAPDYFGPLATAFRRAASGTGPPPSTEDIQLAGRAVVLGHSLRANRGAW